MAKTSPHDDNIFGDSVVREKPKKAKGRQEDGTWVTSDGSVLPARKERRVPYTEPENKQVEGNAEVVQTPDGNVSFLAVRMSPTQFRQADFPERKRQKCWYKVTEIFAGKPRIHYSYDELEQLRRGEMQR